MTASKPKAQPLKRTHYRIAVLLVAFVASSTQLGCASIRRPAATMELTRHSDTPRDASVIINERYVGPLYYVAAHGVRVPAGTHRITITKQGYFPYDKLVEVDGSATVELDVQLTPVPD